MKAAAAIVAALLLAAAVGAATSPTFAEVLKAWFSLQKADGGLKQAADNGYAESVNKQVTDQGITLRVKEAIHDVFRISILFGLEQDGKALNSNLLFEAFIPDGTVDVNGDKSKNKSFMTDGQGRAFVVKESVIIEAKTGKPVSVTIPSNEAGKKTKTLTKEESIKLVKPVPKKLFDVDLSSYTLKIDKDWGDYKFSSKGKETIVAKINKAGELVRIERKVKK